MNDIASGAMDHLPIATCVVQMQGQRPTITHANRVQHDKERALRESAKRLQDIVDNVNALIYLKAADGRYIFINHHYEEFLDVRREEVQGKDDFDLWPEHIASSYTANASSSQIARRRLLICRTPAVEFPGA